LCEGRGFEASQVSQKLEAITKQVVTWYTLSNSQSVTEVSQASRGHSKPKSKGYPLTLGGGRFGREDSQAGVRRPKPEPGGENRLYPRSSALKLPTKRGPKSKVQSRPGVAGELQILFFWQGYGGTPSRRPVVPGVPRPVNTGDSAILEPSQQAPELLKKTTSQSGSIIEPDFFRFLAPTQKRGPTPSHIN